MGAAEFFEVVEGFSPTDCYNLLRQDYYESIKEYYGGSIATTDTLKIVKNYPDFTKKTERRAAEELEQLLDKLQKRECGVQVFPIGYGVVKLEKSDNKVKDGSRKYTVKVYRWNRVENTLEPMEIYDKNCNSLREAISYTKELFYRLPLDYVNRLYIVVESWKGKRRITFTTTLKKHKKLPKKLPKKSRWGKLYKFCFFGWGAI